VPPSKAHLSREPFCIHVGALTFVISVRLRLHNYRRRAEVVKKAGFSDGLARLISKACYRMPVCCDALARRRCIAKAASTIVIEAVSMRVEIALSSGVTPRRMLPNT